MIKKFKRGDIVRVKSSSNAVVFKSGNGDIIINKKRQCSWNNHRLF